MKKLIFILSIITFLSSCSNDDNNESLTTQPNIGDNITIQDVVGTYKPYNAFFENSTDVYHFEHNQKLTFNKNYTGYDFTYNGDHAPFIWSISNNVISFTHSKYGYAMAWIKDGKLSFKHTLEQQGGLIVIFQYIKE